MSKFWLIEVVLSPKIGKKICQTMHPLTIPCPAFLVRGGNPKGISDWSDLVRDDVKLVFPNPKTSGNARYTYLAAYAYALEQNGGDDAKAREFVGKLLSNVAVFDTGGRGATTSFVERGHRRCTDHLRSGS